MLALWLSALAVCVADAGVVGDVSVGTAAPPATLGGYPMTAFPLDGRPLGNNVTDVPAPGGGNIGFNPQLDHVRIGLGWNTWSNGYTGDVYYTLGTTETLTFPASTYAFYFYAEPNNLTTFTITATANGGASTTQQVLGNGGARFYGFYGTDGDTLASIAIVADAGAGGFAVGEFGIARVQVCEGLASDASVGTNPPPATLGHYPMTAFAADNRPLMQDVSDVPAPGGGTVDFCPDPNHRRVGQGWGTWSNGYTGDVYFQTGNEQTMYLPEGTFAFYFYAEPDNFGQYSITAVANTGTTITQNVEGNAGARYYGFYSCNDGTTIDRIVVRADPAAAGFAVGEFGICRTPLCLGIGVDLTPGTGAPPPTLGGYEVIPFLPDTRPTMTDVNNAFGPLAHNIGFSIPLNHRRIGDGWASWSHGYTGDVYYTNGSTQVTVAFPAGTYAFYLYAEPNPFSPVEFIIRANDGTNVDEIVDGSGGAQYFGFYTCRGTVSLTSLTVISDTDFAIGEFGLAARNRGDLALLTETLPGTNAPPPVLGGYHMLAFPADPQPLSTPVGSVNAPGGGALGFSPAYTHYRIGLGWATWSNGYTGDVYYNSTNTGTLTMPNDTYAFYFYAEPDAFGTFAITAVANDGTSITQNVAGSAGAAYYGFYSASRRTTIDYIIVTSDPGAGGCAVGEFGIARLPREALLGDMNCDGLVNNFDITPFVKALTDPAGYQALYPCCDINRGDINGDGLVNNFDITPFVHLLTGG